MKPIGIINSERLKYIPKKYWAHHEFCFHLHDLMTALLRQMESQQAAHVKFDIKSEDEIELLQTDIHILDFLAQSGREDLERRAVINHVCNALFSDMLHFIYEALRALEKRKFAVAYTLLRKPFKEGLLIVSQMCADENLFFEKMKSDAGGLLDRRELDEIKVRALLKDAAAVSRCSNFVKHDNLYDIIFNYQNPNGFAVIFDKATHLATSFNRNKTENYNLNFIFKNPEDDDVYAGSTYAQIAQVLLFIHFMQIELYGRMKEPSKKYQNWMLFTSVCAFESLFKKGPSRMTKLLKSQFQKFAECVVCGSKITIKKLDTPRLVIGERLDCNHCSTNQHFPIGWLLSKVDLDFFSEDTD